MATAQNARTTGTGKEYIWSQPFQFLKLRLLRPAWFLHGGNLHDEADSVFLCQYLWLLWWQHQLPRQLSRVGTHTRLNPCYSCPLWKTNGFCTSRYYSQEQKRAYCARSCGLCDDNCSDKDPRYHPSSNFTPIFSCPIWKKNGFCTSAYFSREQIQSYCPRSCGYCDGNDDCFDNDTRFSSFFSKTTGPTLPAAQYGNGTVSARTPSTRKTRYGHSVPRRVTCVVTVFLPIVLTVTRGSSFYSYKV